MTVYRFALNYLDKYLILELMNLSDGITVMIIDHTDDMLDEFPMGKHSLTMLTDIYRSKVTPQSVIVSSNVI